MPLKKPKKQTSRRKRRKLSPKGPWRLTRRGVLMILAVVAGVFILYVGVLDLQIRSQFEGKKWALPARVYARPLELYPGLALSQKTLRRYLQMLNYREGGNAPGEFQQQGNIFSVHSRGFAFSEGYEAPLRLRLMFNGGVLSTLTAQPQGRDVQLLRLEPLHIASIYPGHKEDRDLIKLAEAPSLLLQTLLAVEDRDFHQHYGIKPLSIMRALLANIRAGATVQGGSTLTQQLVKNFFLSNERTLQRKTVEAMMAILLEWHYSKQEILQTYLNEIYLGQEGERAIHGFALGSRFYFDRPLQQLQPQQIALLVALVKGPSYYDPRKHPERTQTRRNRVLEIMHSEGLLTDAQYHRARLSDLQVKATGSGGLSRYPAYLDLVKYQLRRDYRDEDLKTEGLRIFTTLDPVMQAAAEQALSEQIGVLEKNHRMPREQLQGALVLSSVDSGEVLAAVGDRQADYPGFNRVLSARRPIGSLIKPVIYLEALAHSALYHPMTMIEDTPLTIENPGGQAWRPQNYDREFHGTIPLYEGLVYSYNAASARLGMTLGVENVLQTLRRLGFERSLPAYPSVLLGSVEMSPYEVTQIYQALAAGGFYVPLRAVREVLTVDNQPLQYYGMEIKQTVDSGLAYILNSLLQRVVREGTARAAGVQLPELQAAGKTGTSDDLKDSWFAGYTGQHLAVVWLGRDDNKPVQLSGASGALPVWVRLISDIQTRPFKPVKPANVEWLRMDAVTGYRSNGKCEKEIDLPFIIGSAPERIAECRKKSFLRRLFE